MCFRKDPIYGKQKLKILRLLAALINKALKSRIVGFEGHPIVEPGSSRVER